MPTSAVEDLLGRTRETAVLRAWLDAGERLITVLGTAGIGKTALVRVVAGERGAVVVDLSSCREAAGAAAAIALALSKAPAATEAVCAAEEVLLEAEPAVVVLDTVEHLVDELAPLLSRWLEATVSIQLVLTSRVRLRLRDERVLELLPLALPVAGASPEEAARSAAVRLFCERAERSGARPPAASELELVAQIVGHLDGIPLAIELCAQRARSFGLPALLEQLRGPAGMAACAVRGVPARHTSVEQAVAWSWRLLGPEAQGALRRCATIRGSFTAADAGAVGREDGPAVLEALADASLLRLELPEGDQTRFRMFEIVRSFALERLREAGEEASTHERHAAHFLAQAARQGDAAAVGPALEDLTAIVDRFERTQPEMAARAALAAAGRSTVAGGVAPGMWLLGRALSLPLADATRAALHRSRGRLRSLSGQSAEAIVDLRAAIGLCSDLESEAFCRTDLAVELARAAGEAEARAELALLDARLGDRADAELSRARAVADWHLGDVASAIHRARHALETFEREEAASSALGARMLLGMMLVTGGRREEGRFVLTRCLAEAEASGAGARAVHVRASLLQADLAQGELERPLRELPAVIAELARLGWLRRSLWASCYLGAVEYLCGDAAAGRTRIDHACDGLSRLGTLGRVGIVLGIACGSGAARAHLAMLSGGGDALPEAYLPFAEVLDLTATVEQFERAAAEGSGPGPAQAQRQLQALRHHPLASRPSYRLDLALCARVLEHRLTSGAAVEGTSVLRLGPGAAWFSVAGGPPVSLSSSRVSRALLACLAERRDRAQSSTLEELFAAGWPGERANPAAASNRVYVALTRLRRLGLAGWLVSKKSQWSLHPDLRVEHEGPPLLGAD